MQPELMRNVAIAALCVFAVCYVVLGSLAAALIVLCCVAMTDVCAGRYLLDGRVH